MNTTKKLYKSDTNQVFSGVIGGVGEYLDIDATVLRLAYVLITIATGVFPAIIAYLIAVAIVPQKPRVHDIPKSEYSEKKEETK